MMTLWLKLLIVARYGSLLLEDRRAFALAGPVAGTLMFVHWRRQRKSIILKKKKKDHDKQTTNKCCLTKARDYIWW